jgi:hypothetical protein
MAASAAAFPIGLVVVEVICDLLTSYKTSILNSGKRPDDIVGILGGQHREFTALSLRIDPTLHTHREWQQFVQTMGPSEYVSFSLSQLLNEEDEQEADSNEKEQN